MIMQDTENKRIFKLFGVSSEALCMAKQKIEQASNGLAELTYRESYGDFLVEISFDKYLDSNEADKAIQSFLLTFNEFVYAVQDISLAEMAFSRLKLGERRLKTAESFTGGGLANAIVCLEGASNYFYEGLVCYNEQAKVSRLGVSNDTLKAHTAVSSEVAVQMVKGLLASGNCDIAVATTGYASPPKNKELGGTCFIAVGDDNMVKVRRYKFSGDRESVIKQGVNAGLFALCKALSGLI